MNKRQKLEDQKDTSNHNNSDSEEQIIDEDGNMIRRVNMPKKSKHRMRAHINPMNEIHIPVPKNPDYSNWKLHYPSFFGLENNNSD